MIFDKHYIQVDLDKKIFSGSFQLLPENWHNISCFNSLSDEELEDLTWSGNKNIGWIRFTSPKIKDFDVMRDTFMLIKNNLKKNTVDYENFNQASIIELQSSFYETYDNLLSNKYKVTINQKSLDKVKNLFE